MSMTQEEYRRKLEEYKKNKELKKLKVNADKENTMTLINHGCPKDAKTIDPEHFKKNAKKSVIPSKKVATTTCDKAIKPIKDVTKASCPFTGKDVVNASTKPKVKTSKQELNSISFDNYTKASGYDFETYRQPSGITTETVQVDDESISDDHDERISYNHQTQDEQDMEENILVKNEVMDIADMLESLQLQTPAKPQIKKDEPKSVNFKTAGDGVCISTDGPCLTVLTPVRASRKAEKGIFSQLRSELGVKNVITPVRRSIRNATVIASDASVKKQDQIHNLLNEHDFAYVPNQAFNEN